jgi:hypothetical protein
LAMTSLRGMAASRDERGCAFIQRVPPVVKRTA